MIQRAIDLNALVQSHSSEIERMADAIRGDGQAVWTTELRATTRGGKCWVVPADDESA